jgi:hypothetical protein
MRTFKFPPNIRIDGDEYLEGFLGLSWFPSDKAKQNRSNYELGVEGVLSRLLQKYTSYQVLAAIKGLQGRTITIKPRPFPPPLPGQDPNDAKCAAKVLPDDRVKATVAGEPAPAPGKDEVEDHTLGTGQGSDAVLRYNWWVYNNRGGFCPNEPGRDDDEILLHELVHALSSLQGRLAESMTGPAGYTNLEEFTAIVVSNVYASETKRTLRMDHGGFTPLKSDLAKNDAFYAKYKDYLLGACKNHPDLIKKLQAATGIPFNPFLLCKF